MQILYNVQIQQSVPFQLNTLVPPLYMFYMSSYITAILLLPTMSMAIWKRFLYILMREHYFISLQ